MATLLVEACLVGAVVALDGRQERSEPATPSGASSLDAPRSAALAELPWAADAYREQAAYLDGIVATPFVGDSYRDVEGRHVNVTGRVRRSYETPLLATQEPVDVWFFGGSTMFGLDLQRDEHTIPSEVVRLAEADGIAIRARNYGAPGYTSYQEALLLALLLTRGAHPDLVVFYDGTNDWALGLQSALGLSGPTGEPTIFHAEELRRALAEVLGQPADSVSAPSPLRDPPAGDRSLTLDELLDTAIDVYEQSIVLSDALSDRYGVPVARFWQPDFFSRDPLDPGEVELLGPLGMDEHDAEVVRTVLTRLRSRLPAEVVDVSDALDDLDGPVLSDWAHVNEVGGRAVAEAMYAHLRPQITALADP